MAADTWLGKHPVISTDDIPGLEAQSAIHEFRNRLPRDRAEQMAHDGYKKEKAIENAAHHLLGVRAAFHAGHKEAAAAHSAAYAYAAQHLGFDPAGEPPQEIVDRVETMKSPYAFKKHPADAMFAPPEPEAAK